jgi:hypothetical protein
MNPPFVLTAQVACLLCLGACDKTTALPSTPSIGTPMAVASAAAPGAAAGSSVPSAESVLSPANTASTEPPRGRSNAKMSSAQESTAMPMPGQNNDHSAPLSSAK